MNSWWNSTPLLCKAPVCRSSRTRFVNLQKFRTIFYTKMKKNVSDMWKIHVMCLGPCPLNSWWNSTPFLCKALACRSSRTRGGKSQKFRTIFYTKPNQHVLDTWNTQVMCLGSCPLNFWWNSTPFWYKTCPFMTSRTRVRNCAKIWHTVLYQNEKHMSDMWNTHVTCMRPYPLNSWQNSTPFWCKTLAKSL